MENLDDLYKELEDYASANYVPIIKQDTLEVMLNEIKKLQPKSILEIGTAIGYSGTKMLEVASQAKLFTMEIDTDRANIARDTFNKAKVSDRVVLWEGDALEILRYLDGKYDFVFLDGPKGHYLEMLPYILNCMNKGAVLFSDNVLFHGYVEQEKIYKKKGSIIRNMRSFNDAIMEVKELDTKMIDVGDGIMISVKR